MSDEKLIAWLREEARICEAMEEPNLDYYEHLHDAANEIEAKDDTIDELRALLREAIQESCPACDMPDNEHIVGCEYAAKLADKEENDETEH